MGDILTISDKKLSFLISNLRIKFPQAGPWYWYVPVQDQLDILLEPGYVVFELDGDGNIIGVAQVFPPRFYEAPFLSGSENWSYIFPGTETLTNPGVPLLPFGFSSLEAAIVGGISDGTNHLGFTPPTGQGPPGPDIASFGLLPMITPPLPPPLYQAVPNIWQLTGLQQPKRLHPAQLWNDPNYALANVSPFYVPGPNPYVPTVAQAALAAHTFVSMWNASSAAQNAATAAMVAANNPALLLASPNAAGWAFKVPFFGNQGNAQAGTSTIFSFWGGLPTGWIVGAPLVEYNPATSTLLACDQLDPKKWDTTQFPPILKP